MINPLNLTIFIVLEILSMLHDCIRNKLEYKQEKIEIYLYN